ncbi:predicted protein [Botrytis cinerea T4]|uniref:Uncharacterized protein n=1 Tax=Botryotinia fuckeliana (strain T4) TaxID=999810 RepID=G2YLS7_BOTF4|nr:predicted protein [Botrytis cinerea T4]
MEGARRRPDYLAGLQAGKYIRESNRYALAMTSIANTKASSRS